MSPVAETAGIGPTRVEPVLARLLTATALITVLAVPLLREPSGFEDPALRGGSGDPALRGGSGGSGDPALRGGSGGSGDPALRGGSGVPALRGGSGETHPWLAANRALLSRMDDLERALERESVLQRQTLPAAQWLMTAAGGVGNEQVYVGRDGWLFYRPGIDYLTGPGFLSPAVLERRSRSGASWERAPQPDPLRAILDFHRQLGSRGIRLLVVPTPTKAMVYPDTFSATVAGRPLVTELHNPSFAAFRAELERQGVIVFDPAPILRQARHDLDEDVFLRTDSHWSAAGIDAVALALAERLHRLELSHRLHRGGLGIAGGAAGARAAREQTGSGDLLRMLELPGGQRLFPEETVSLRPQPSAVEAVKVAEAGVDPSSTILLLGDSFSNVFSGPDLGWGEAAGLVEQLGFHLGRPIDRLVVNDGGASGLRQRLAQEMAAGRDRLAGKELVIYQFAVRELTSGDWRLVRLPSSASAATPPAGSWSGHGVIAAIARVPPAGTTPYRDALVAIHLTEIERPSGDMPPSGGTGSGRATPGEVLVYAWGLRDDRHTRAAGYRPGQRLEVRLRPWSEVAELESYQRLELADEELLFLDAYFAESHAVRRTP